jgi:hypothetical protein
VRISSTIANAKHGGGLFVVLGPAERDEDTATDPGRAPLCIRHLLLSASATAGAEPEGTALLAIWSLSSHSACLGGRGSCALHLLSASSGWCMHAGAAACSVSVSSLSVKAGGARVGSRATTQRSRPRLAAPTATVGGRARSSRYTHCATNPPSSCSVPFGTFGAVPPQRGAPAGSHPGRRGGAAAAPHSCCAVADATGLTMEAHRVGPRSAAPWAPIRQCGLPAAPMIDVDGGLASCAAHAAAACAACCAAHRRTYDRYRHAYILTSMHYNTRIVCSYAPVVAAAA